MIRSRGLLTALYLAGASGLGAQGERPGFGCDDIATLLRHPAIIQPLLQDEIAKRGHNCLPVGADSLRLVTADAGPDFFDLLRNSRYFGLTVRAESDAPVELFLGERAIGQPPAVLIGGLTAGSYLRAQRGSWRDSVRIGRWTDSSVVIAFHPPRDTLPHGRMPRLPPQPQEPRRYRAKASHSVAAAVGYGLLGMGIAAARCRFTHTTQEYDTLALEWVDARSEKRFDGPCTRATVLVSSALGATFPFNWQWANAEHDQRRQRVYEAELREWRILADSAYRVGIAIRQNEQIIAANSVLRAATLTRVGIGWVPRLSELVWP